MTGQDWPVGTVAEITWDGRGMTKTTRAIRTKDRKWSLDTDWASCLRDADVTDVRPLVVLDIEPIGSHLHPNEQARGGVVTMLRDTGSEVARKIADQIEAQTKPPRIPEPMVTGMLVRAGRGLWARSDEGSWICLADGYAGMALPWAALVDPEVIS